jgi:PRC-barrel domain
MALYKIKDFDPDYRDHFGDDDVKGLDLYSKNEKIGSVNDVLVDDDGQFRYLVINTGAWIFGKKVLLPIGRCRIDYNTRRVNVDQLTKEQVESLPEFSDEMVADYDYEERVRGVYRSSMVDDPAAAGVGRSLATTARLVWVPLVCLRLVSWMTPWHRAPMQQ